MFVSIEGIEPTNNDAQRVLRHDVLRRKSSGGTDSEAGSRFVGRMLSVVVTCGKQNRNFLELLTACYRARLDDCVASSLLLAEAQLAAAGKANLTLPWSRNRRNPLTRGAFSGRFPSILGILGVGQNRL